MLQTVVSLGAGLSVCLTLISFKGLVHFEMKISPSFTHPQAILGVYDFLLSDEHNQRYIKGLVHPKMKILSFITHPHAVPHP